MLIPMTGDHCEVKFDYCEALNPCSVQNTLSCENLASNYKCHCKTGWVGPDCTINEDNCRSSPCVNGKYVISHQHQLHVDSPAACYHILSVVGRCYDLVDDYKCVCDEHWTGHRCETPVDSCENSPCQNQGTCYNLLGDGYACKCPIGTDGMRCETNIDNCVGVL